MSSPMYGSFVEIEVDGILAIVPTPQLRIGFGISVVDASRTCLTCKRSQVQVLVRPPNKS
jgi:hypothetical protein